jgi:hypothetical protein
MAVILPSAGNFGLVNKNIAYRLMFTFEYGGLNLPQGGGGQDTDLSVIVGAPDRQARGVFHSIRLSTTPKADEFDVTLRTATGVGSDINTNKQLMIWEGATNGWMVASYDGMHIPYLTEVPGRLFLQIKNNGTSGAITAVTATVVVDVDQHGFTPRWSLFGNA